MKTKQLEKILTKSFNRIAKDVNNTNANYKKLPQCKICGHYTTSMEIHLRVAHKSTGTMFVEALKQGLQEEDKS